MTMPVTWPPSSHSLMEEDQLGTTTKMTDRVRGRERHGEGTDAQVNHRAVNVQAASGPTKSFALPGISLHPTPAAAGGGGIARCNHP
jgi:hypothetical protein